MTQTDVIASLALLISGGAFALEVRRWFESGARLSISLMPDMVEFPHDDGRPKCAIIVYNLGLVPTTITHCVLFGYASPFHRWFGRPMFNGIVPSARIDENSTLKRIDVNETWMGRFYYDDALKAAREKKQLYAGVIATHRNRPYLKRVPTEAEANPPGKLYEDD